MNNIYLVGFMGTGKTSAGREVSKRRKSGFVDLDDLIERKEGRMIAEIFADKKEAYFRALEKDALREISEKENLVVACGGGIVIDQENIQLMKKTGRLICLTATGEEILKRIKGKTHRPLLNVDNPLEKIKELLEKRRVYYAGADAQIDTSGLSVLEVADKILELVAK